MDSTALWEQSSQQKHNIWQQKKGTSCMQWMSTPMCVWGRMCVSIRTATSSGAIMRRQCMESLAGLKAGRRLWPRSRLLPFGNAFHSVTEGIQSDPEESTKTPLPFLTRTHALVLMHIHWHPWDIPTLYSLELFTQVYMVGETADECS